ALLAGGTTRSRVPVTTSVGVRIEPRNGMLDHCASARAFQAGPSTLATGQPCAAAGGRASSATDRLPGTPPRPHEVAASTSARTLCGDCATSCCATAPPCENP